MSAKFCIQVEPKAQKRREKTRLFFEVFFAFLIFHRFVFFLSLRPRARILSSFHARQKEREREKERERLREEFEVFFDSFYLY